MNDFAPIAHFALLLARPGMLVMTAPAFGGTYAPAHVRLGLTMLLALILGAGVHVPAVAGAMGLSLIVAREMAIGFALALAIRALIAGAELGGQLSGTQLMFSYGSVVNPQGGVRNNLIGNLYSNLALFTFFGINGHHVFVRGLTASYERLPIGVGQIDASIVRSVMQMLGVVFAVGIRLAAPLIVVMLVVELATGLIARAAPSINLMIVGVPIRLIVGLLTVAAVAPLVPAVVSRFSSTIAALGLQAAQAFR